MIRIPLKTIDMDVVLRIADRLALIGIDGQYVVMEEAQLHAKRLLDMINRYDRFVGWIGLAMMVECVFDSCTIATRKRHILLGREKTRNVIEEILRKTSLP